MSTGILKILLTGILIRADSCRQISSRVKLVSRFTSVTVAWVNQFESSSFNVHVSLKFIANLLTIADMIVQMLTKSYLF